MSEPRGTITRIAEGGAIGAGLAVIKGTDTNKQAKLPAAAGDRALGITGNAVDAAGKPLTIVTAGQVLAIASAAIAVGDPVEVAAASGKLRTAAPAAGVNAHLIGFAQTSAAADGDPFEVEVAPSIMQGA